MTGWICKQISRKMNTVAPLSTSDSIITRKPVKAQLAWLRVGIHLLGLYPLIQLAHLLLADRWTANPIQFIEQYLGRAALDMLVLTLAVTPVVTLTGWKSLARHRRTLGLYSFFYFSLHFLTFAVLDYNLDVREMLRLILEKPYLLVGLLAGLILLSLAATSFRYWRKHLGRNWKRLHKTVYLASGLVVLHYALAVKGSLDALSGDILRPLVMGLLVSFLLILRLVNHQKHAAPAGAHTGLVQPTNLSKP